MQNTTPPKDDANYPHSVPTSIEIAGPGNYGKTEIDDGNEIVLLNDDVLTSVANATVVIIDGNDLERITVLYQFPQFLEHCPDDCINVMVPRICSEAVNWSPDAQMAAAEALFFVVNMKAPHHIAKQIAWASLSVAGKTTSPEVFDACGEIVSMILPQVHRYDVLHFIVPDAVDRAVSSRAIDRRLAARIIGSLNDALTADELESIFDKTCIKLSEDEDDTVRAMMAQSLAAVATKLPLRVAESVLWPRLKKLMNDENPQVRAAAMRAIAKSAEAHKAHAQNSVTYSTLLKPLFLEECDKSSKVAGSDLRTVSDDTYLTLEIFSEVYGYFLSAISDLLNSDETWTTVVNTLRQMVTCNGPTVRHWCAFNMPAVTSVCSSAKYEHLNGVIPALAADSDTEARATLAKGIHEITRALCNTSLRGDVIRAIGMLFMDENAQVRMNALGHFSQLLALLSPKAKKNKEVSKNKAVSSGDENNEGNSKETESERLAPMFSSLEMMSFDSWRTQKLLAEELQKSAHLIPQDMLCEYVAPLLFQMARESTFLVRKASMRALMYTLRYIPDVRRRTHIMKHFRNEWAHGKVYWTRLAYIEAAECAHNMFSTKLFTHLFKDEVLNMHSDQVANVRLRLLRLMNILVPIWRTIPEFQNVLRALARDKDAQIAGEATFLMALLPKIAPPSEQQKQEDKTREAAEEAFFIHKSNKKRKNKPRSSGQKEGATDSVVPQAGTTTPATTPAEPSREIVPSKSSKPAVQAKKRNSRELDSKQSSGKIANPPNSVVTQDATVKPLKSPEKRTSNRDQAISELKVKDMDQSEDPKGATAEEEEAENPRDNGFVKRLFTSCFGKA